MAILKPFLLKKLITGPITVPVNQTTTFVIIFEEPNLSCIILSVCLWLSALLVGCGSSIKRRPILHAMITIPKTKKVICQ